MRPGWNIWEADTTVKQFVFPPDEDLSGVTLPGVAEEDDALLLYTSGSTGLPRGGVQGEIMIRGDNVMKRYYKAPDIATLTLESDGWLHTGDLGSMDEDGFVFAAKQGGAGSKNVQRAEGV